jgi:hypothetical protein
VHKEISALRPWCLRVVAGSCIETGGFTKMSDPKHLKGTSMAGQGVQRREILRILGTTAAHFPGFSKWGFACGQVGKALQISPAQPACAGAQ